MKDRFSRFALRLAAAVLLGLGTLLLHGRYGILGKLLAPTCASAWELSKLAFWPMLGALALTARSSGGAGKTLRAGAPYLVLTPAAMCLLVWAVTPFAPRAGLALLMWITALVVGLALADQGRLSGRSGLWVLLAAALAAAYLLFSLLPPAAGPFLDPSDAAAMAVLPC